MHLNPETMDLPPALRTYGKNISARSARHFARCGGNGTCSLAVCTMGASLLERTPQTGNSLFSLDSYLLPGQADRHRMADERGTAAPGCNKKCAKGNKKMAPRSALRKENPAGADAHSTGREHRPRPRRPL